MNANEIYKLYLEDNPRISTDSRSSKIYNTTFFGIKGEYFNGNDFAEEAIRRGAKIAIVDNGNYKNNKSFIVVENTLKTLHEIAKIHREKYNIPIIGITGSNGKTTTKNILTKILSSKYNTISTEGNLNNHIGVPLTVLSIRKNHEIGVIEMGANHLGEIRSLCEIAKPTHGLITNISHAHIGEFGSFQNIINAKNELFEYLKKHGGYIFYNQKDDILVKLVNNYKNCISYQLNGCKNSEKNNKSTSYQYMCNPFINIEHPKIGHIKTKIIGKYNINNIIASIKIAHILKTPNTKIKNSLKGIELKNNRSQFIEKRKNNIILDAYNANPTSMSMGILNFIEINKYLKYKNMWFILGDMLELGKNEIQYHQEIINALNNEKIENCILVGRLFNRTTSKNNYLKVQSVNECIDLVSKLNIKNTSIFIKGSRNLKLEKVINYL